MNQHYFTAQPVARPDELRLVKLEYKGRQLQFWVSPKVFSSARLDPGTEQLLAALPDLPDSGTFLDLGCGWGPIAVSLAKVSPGALVWAVDVNPRAVSLTARNAEINSTKNVFSMSAASGLAQAQAEDVRFDLIVSNPPIRIGKEALHEMLSLWFGRLSPSGEGWLVVNKNLGADSLTKWFNGNGYDAWKHSSRKGFRIIRVRRSNASIQT